MARKRNGTGRIEPRFDVAPVSVSAKDRISTGKAAPATRSTKPAKAGKKKKKSDTFWLWRLIGFFLRPLPKLTYWGVVFGLWGGVAVAGIIAFYAVQLPSANTWAVPQRPPNVRILAADGSLIANRGVTGGKALALEDMAPAIAQAVIAIEDRRFHSHFGFDFIGFTRAMVRNVMQKRLREGGSTITQQLAKNLFLKPDRTFGRKVQELILAVWLETKYSKAEILELYLNRVYFGAGATGVDAASRRYFGKSAKNVSISEAALLAGLLKAPSRYSPAVNAERAQQRARVVLRAMQEEGYIKPGEINIAAATPGENARHFRSGPENFIADLVMKKVRKLTPDLKYDVVVKTTISPFLMAAAQETIQASLEKSGKKFRVSQASLASIAPNGAIRAMIGGRDYAKSQFNRATDAKRQPGSAFKTIVWLTAMEAGFDPNSVLIDEPVRYGKWKPENYTKRYQGPVTLNNAFAKSLNTIAAKLTMQAGPKQVVRTAKKLGIGSKLTPNASLSLGTSEVSLLELTAAYAPFANGGLLAKPYIINRISEVGDKGKTLYQHRKPKRKRIIGTRELGMMNAMLNSVVTSGTGKAARLAAHPGGGKTGTSQNFRDAWFIGNTAHLVTGIWFGNDNNRPTRKLTGGALPAKAWKRFMEIAHTDLPFIPLPGEPVFLTGSIEKIPVPTPRPARPGEVSPKTAPVAPVLEAKPKPPADIGEQETANLKPSLRDRVNKVVENQVKKSISDLILGN